MYRTFIFLLYIDKSQIIHKYLVFKKKFLRTVVRGDFERCFLKQIIRLTVNIQMQVLEKPGVVQFLALA